MYGKYVSMVSNSPGISYALLPRPWRRLLLLTILTYLLTMLTIWDIPHDAFSYGFTESYMVSMYGKYVSMVSNSQILSYALLPRPCESYCAQQRDS